MPYWSFEQERLLEDMVNQNKPIEEIAGHFHRSVESVELKIRRLGLVIPESKKGIEYTSYNATLYD
jgi:hypothetical protein